LDHCFKAFPFFFFSCLVKANRGEGQQEKIKCILAYLAQVVESMPQGRFLCFVDPDLESGFNWVSGSGSRKAKMTHKN
jgi:hypothetical protein